MSEQIRCPSCGCQISSSVEVCEFCGQQIAVRDERTASTKYCQHCGSLIDKECIVCPKCGKQVAELRQEQPQIVINNSNMQNIPYKKEKNKWVAFLLCLFLGEFGFHRFYEGKIGTGIIWLLTFGLFGIGWLIDLIRILCKPNPYYV